jgi:hypothetical protein
VPTVANGGITNGGKTYIFHIKPDVDWNTTPPRQVTSQDSLREFKAFFNPVSPVGNPVYYESTIASLTQYANEETRLLRQHQGAPADGGEHHELPGHAQHLRHRDAELLDHPVLSDRPGQRLPVHADDTVHLGGRDVPGDHTGWDWAGPWDGCCLDWADLVDGTRCQPLAA